jgi:hypothetical protein
VHFECIFHDKLIILVQTHHHQSSSIIIIIIINHQSSIIIINHQSSIINHCCYCLDFFQPSDQSKARKSKLKPEGLNTLEIPLFSLFFSNPATFTTGMTSTMHTYRSIQGIQVLKLRIDKHLHAWPIVLAAPARETNNNHLGVSRGSSRSKQQENKERARTHRHN